MFITDIYLANIEAVEIPVVHPAGAAHSQLLYDIVEGSITPDLDRLPIGIKILINQ